MSKDACAMSTWSCSPGYCTLTGGSAHLILVLGTTDHDCHLDTSTTLRKLAETSARFSELEMRGPKIGLLQ